MFTSFVGDSGKQEFPGNRTLDFKSKDPGYAGYVFPFTFDNNSANMQPILQISISDPYYFSIKINSGAL